MELTIILKTESGSNFAGSYTDGEEKVSSVVNENASTPEERQMLSAASASFTAIMNLTKKNYGKKTTPAGKKSGSRPVKPPKED